MGGLGLSLSSSLIHATDAILPRNDHKEFLKLIDKTKTQFSSLSMTGIDPTVEFISKRQNGDYGAVRPGLAFLNDNKENAVIDVPVFPHSVEQNPNSLGRVMLIPRRGNTCYEFDVYQNKVVTKLQLDKKRFYGHGCYIPGTTLFIASTFVRTPADSAMTVFDLSTGKFLNDIVVEGGAGAHQCSLSYDKKHIIITFSEPTATHQTSIAWFDVNTLELKNRVFGMRPHAEHFSDLSDGNLIFTGGVEDKDEQTVIGNITPDKIVKNLQLEKSQLRHLIGLSVSICGVEEKGISIMTNLVEDSVYVWDYKNDKLLKRINVLSPRGLSLSNDRKKVFVTSLANHRQSKSFISVINLDSFEVVEKFHIINALAYSSHITKFLFS